MEETHRKSGLVIFLSVLALIAVAGVAMWWFMNRDTSTDNADRVAESLTSVPDPNRPYTLGEVASHSKPANCWTVVDGKIYNLTAVIKAHPGIAELEQSCGKDGTATIKSKTFPTGEKDANGIPAPQPSADMLSPLQIGRTNQQ